MTCDCPLRTTLKDSRSSNTILGHRPLVFKDSQGLPSILGHLPFGVQEDPIRTLPYPILGHCPLVFKNPRNPTLDSWTPSFGVQGSSNTTLDSWTPSFGVQGYLPSILQIRISTLEYHPQTLDSTHRTCVGVP
ncbi:hypothetical protein CEXT_237951 [Caerostris extrusa]|uniref:Uncharacterized protein n=1 Tax=Caerostris extrusa TaxID=172846 RepID=A0AAV4QB11_CAEEX|nr:hypothetical protein CEXT_237951 [Caerostris extrusa]